MPQTSKRSTLRNHLLASMLEADYRLLKPHLEAINLPLRHKTEESGKPVRHIYFPDSGLISVIATGARKREIEVGLIGREGVSSVNALMGDDRALHSTYVQIAGRGRRIKLDILKEVFRDSETLLPHLLHFASAFMFQIAHTALANGQAKIEERLARWLLMAHDRIDGDEIFLTHEFLALMMCVRRAGVTTAVNLLLSRGLIDSKRGRIIVRDRSGIKAIANGFYGIPEAEYQRLTGWRPKN